MDRLRGSRRRSPAAGRGLDGFLLALGQSTLSGDVIPVVLRHAADLLGASAASLVLRDADGRRCWTLADDAVVLHPSSASIPVADPEELAPHGRRDGSPGIVVRRQEVEVDGAAGHAIVGVRTAHDDGELVLTLTRTGRRGFDDRAGALMESVIAFTDVALQNRRLLSQLQEKADALEHLATHDALTGLANRRRFHDDAAHAIGARSAGAVLLVDLDRFKEVNDTLGHHVGDQLLIEVARRLRAAVGRRGLIARLGGDEFAVLLPPASRDELLARAEDLQSVLERPVDVGEVAVDVGASVGVALAEDEDDEPTVSNLLRRADVAMYAAKGARTGVEVYSDDLDHYRPETLALVPRFRGAIEHGELHVAFQPQIDTDAQRVVGAEALARWSIPGIGPVPPADFIPIAESTGLILPLTEQVLLEAVAQCAAWRTRGPDVRVSVNIAPRVLLDPGFADHVSGLLDDAELPAELLRLEVTETTVMSDPDRAIEVLRDLADRGITVAIDDFGTGHSSLAYLTSLPCHEIKIDRSFITALDAGNTRATAVVSSIIGLGRDLSIDVIAEGVETRRAADHLQLLGCRVIQGFLYSRPMPAAQLSRVLAGVQPLGSHAAPTGPAALPAAPPDAPSTAPFAASLPSS